MDAKKPTKQVLIRLPEDLKEWLTKKAEENYRSVNGEIVSRLQESRDKEEGADRS
jgi:hypothetical protein